MIVGGFESFLSTRLMLRLSDSLRDLECPIVVTPFLAKCVQFCDNGDSVIVFYLESHEM